MLSIENVENCPTDFKIKITPGTFTIIVRISHDNKIYFFNGDGSIFKYYPETQRFEDGEVVELTFSGMRYSNSVKFKRDKETKIITWGEVTKNFSIPL